MPGDVAFNHVGHCVSDLARSRSFYEHVLGFVFEREIAPPDDPSAKLLNLEPPVGMTACYLRRDGLVLELLHFGARPTVDRPARVMNELGLTHLSLSVDDVDDTCRRVREHGGDVLDQTNIGVGIFVRDPDGQLIELLPMSYRKALDAAGD
jgi:catechol 2,3-dioxygenase-like lactoylglutathione lyase family enzyme